MKNEKSPKGQVETDRPVTVNLNAEVWRALRTVVEGHTWEASPEELLEAFVHDLTDSDHSAGSDEREYSRAWVRRRYGPPEIVAEMRDQRDHWIGEEVF